MMILLGVLLAVVVALSFAALGVFGLLGLVAAVATLRAARRDRRLADELDAVLEEIVGPRSPSASTFER